MRDITKKTVPLQNLVSTDGNITSEGRSYNAKASKKIGGLGNAPSTEAQYTKAEMSNAVAKTIGDHKADFVQ